MVNQPLVSLFIPFKNTATFIEDCILSIKAQTYQSWEAIFIDDHSDDASFSCVEKYAEKDGRIRLYKNNGSGIIEALRMAFKKSNGIYVSRMDSDDLMTNTRLELMVNDLEKNGRNHLSVGLVNYFRADGVSDGYRRYQKWLNELTMHGNNYSEIYKECVIPSPCWMLHRDDFLACGAFNPNRYPEDYDLTFRFYKAHFICLPCNEVLLHWRDYSTRTSRTHQHYAQNYFLDIKVHYFLELDRDPSRPLAIWGAGAKGKTVAKLLLEHGVSFYWICDNPKKIGKHIYDQQLQNFDFLEQLKHPQSIVTVANENAQTDIKAFFKTQNMKPMSDYFFFC